MRQPEVFAASCKYRERDELAMARDIQQYLPYLHKFDLTDEEKEQFVRDIRMFLEPLADAAFGEHPLQQSRGYLREKSLRNPTLSLDSKCSQVSDLFGEAANDDEGELKEERQEHG